MGAVQIADSDARPRGVSAAIGAVPAQARETTHECARSDGVENSPQNASHSSHETSLPKTRACRCKAPLIGAAKRCRKCEAGYRRARRAKARQQAIDISIHVVSRADKTFGVLVVSSRIEGDEASRGKLYGPYATRQEADAKAALVDQSLEVWGFANGWS